MRLIEHKRTQQCSPPAEFIIRHPFPEHVIERGTPLRDGKVKAFASAAEEIDWINTVFHRNRRIQKRHPRSISPSPFTDPPTHFEFGNVGNGSPNCVRDCLRHKVSNGRPFERRIALWRIRRIGPHPLEQLIPQVPTPSSAGEHICPMRFSDVRLAGGLGAGKHIESSDFD